jgi:tRNA (cytidine/uridine-2'-O-)-methyltransferase
VAGHVGAAQIDIVLFQPLIAPNTGNIGRLCAVTGCRLHLIHPLGFQITDKHLRRAGMDYWRRLEVCEHRSWESFVDSWHGELWLLTTRAEQTLWDAPVGAAAGLLFGNESHGVPDSVHAWVGERRVRIPHLRSGFRSLNLSSAVAVATYEVLRRQAATVHSRRARADAPPPAPAGQ